MLVLHKAGVILRLSVHTLFLFAKFPPRADQTALLLLPAAVCKPNEAQVPDAISVGEVGKAVICTQGLPLEST